MAACPQGLALGTVSHVSVMAALAAAAEAEAAEAAALGFFLVGTGRCLLMMTPPIKAVVLYAMGNHGEEEEREEREEEGA